MATTFTSFAQGTINFSNIKTPVHPKITGFCVPGSMTADPIAGADFLVGILANSPATGNYKGVLKHGALFVG